MPVKPIRKKKAPVAKPPMHLRIAQAWYKHPIAIATAFATFIGAVASGIPAARWIIDHVDAKTVQANLDAHKLADLQQGLWRNVAVENINRGLIDSKLVALRNRVNDCDIDRDRSRPMTSLEARACQQYHDEFKTAQDDYNEASRKVNEARAAALAVSKEK